MAESQLLDTGIHSKVWDKAVQTSGVKSVM